jgi:hypothetical protein
MEIPRPSIRFKRSPCASPCVRANCYSAASIVGTVSGLLPRVGSTAIRRTNSRESEERSFPIAVSPEFFIADGSADAKPGYTQAFGSLIRAQCQPRQAACRVQRLHYLVTLTVLMTISRGYTAP